MEKFLDSRKMQTAHISKRLMTYAYALKFIVASFFLAFGATCLASEPFYWGVASSAYQTEGAYDIDGKGPSNWDYLTHAGITKYYNGEIHNGDVAVDSYKRVEDDVLLLKKLGVNSYRFSVAWSRVLPDGRTVNEKGLLYYRKLVNILIANNIKPLITIYHWDMPLNIYQKGGHENSEFVALYRQYANLLFDEFGKVANFVTFNEPINEVFELVPMTKALSENKIDAYHAVFNSEKTRAEQAGAAHNILLANAFAISDFKSRRLPGKIGLTISLSPQIPKDKRNVKDVRAAQLNREFRNQWLLDPIYFGRYPVNLYNRFLELGWKAPDKSDLDFISKNKPDFIGVNFYSPTEVYFDELRPFGVGVSENSDEHKSYNGKVDPGALYQILKWLDLRYQSPELIITEVGAGFGEKDDDFATGAVNDELRSDFILKHAESALQARADGVNLTGFYVWSLLDNFEWMCAYKCRFGIVHVAFDQSLKRTPKLSFYKYRNFISRTSEGSRP